MRGRIDVVSRRDLDGIPQPSSVLATRIEEAFQRLEYDVVLQTQVQDFSGVGPGIAGDVTLSVKADTLVGAIAHRAAGDKGAVWIPQSELTLDTTGLIVTNDSGVAYSAGGDNCVVLYRPEKTQQTTSQTSSRWYKGVREAAPTAWSAEM